VSEATDCPPHPVGSSLERSIGRFAHRSNSLISIQRPTRGEHEAEPLPNALPAFVNKNTTILLTRHLSQFTILRRVVKSGRKWVQPRSNPIIS